MAEGLARARCPAAVVHLDPARSQRPAVPADSSARAYHTAGSAQQRDGCPCTIFRGHHGRCITGRSTRDGAAVARRAHNPKVGGSNPPPATTVPGAARRFGGSRGVDPPVPIPNTVVKRPSADDTARATGWDNRPLPGHHTRGCRGRSPGTLDPFVAPSHMLHCGYRFTPLGRESLFAFTGECQSVQEWGYNVDQRSARRRNRREHGGPPRRGEPHLS